MSNLEKLLSTGAECVMGNIVWRGKLLGSLRNGDLILTEAGMAELDVDEVEVKEPTPAKVVKVSKASKVEKQTEADDTDLAAELDELLGN